LPAFPALALKDRSETLEGGLSGASAPVIFDTVEMSIAGPPLTPGPVQTYVVDIFSGTASFVIS
jgi:hypothetical protein